MAGTSLVTVEFTQDYTVKDGSGTTYKAGAAVDLEPASAEHFIRRNVAKLAEKKAKRTATDKSAE